MFKQPLENRCYEFAVRVRKLCRHVRQDLPNRQDIRQLVRCSGSVGANYIEANESVGRQDRIFRVAISRKEAKESYFFLALLGVDEPQWRKERRQLMGEAMELARIFSVIKKKLEMKMEAGCGKTN